MGLFSWENIFFSFKKQFHLDIKNNKYVAFEFLFFYFFIVKRS